MISTFANIIARSPPAIGITLGGIGMLLNMPNAQTIFWVSVVLQILWLVVIKGE